MNTPAADNPNPGPVNDDAPDTTDTTTQTADEGPEDGQPEADNEEGGDQPEENQDADESDGEGEGEDGPSDDAAAAAEPETVEIEHEGKAYKVPAVLKDQFLMRQAFTQKTTELAEERKAFQAEQTSARAHIRELAQFTSINDQVAAYEQVDWQDLYRRDPDTYHLEKQNFEDLKTKGGQLFRTIQEKEAQALETNRAQHAKRIEESQAVLKKDIGWSPQLAAKVMDHAANKFGFKPEEISRITDPRIIKVLHAAMTNDQQKKTVAKVQQIEAVQKTKPVPQARSGSSPTTPKDPAKMSDAQYFEMRKKQINGG